MGEIKKVLRSTGEVLETVGSVELNEIAGEPFICVYGQVEPRRSGNQELIEKELASGLHAYVRFNTSEKVNQTIGAGQSGSFVATKQALEVFGMSESEVWEKATENMKAIGMSFRSMIEIEAEMMGLTREEFEQRFFKIAPEQELYVASMKAHDGQHGAGVLAMPCMLEAIRESMGDFVIIPSSVHEIICIPPAIYVNRDIDEIREMVHEVNGTVLEPMDVLSEDVYMFDAQGLSVL